MNNTTATSIDEMLSAKSIERRAAGLGYELKRNQVTGLWHWQIIDSTTLDWRGTGFVTKTEACRSFAQNAAEFAPSTGQS